MKSAAIPDVLSGKDLLQGNAPLAGGRRAVPDRGDRVRARRGRGAPAWLVVLAGAVVLAIGALAATKLRHVEARAHAARFSEEARRVLRTIAQGIREVAARPPRRWG